MWYAHAVLEDERAEARALGHVAGGVRPGQARVVLDDRRDAGSSRSSARRRRDPPPRRREAEVDVEGRSVRRRSAETRAEGRSRAEVGNDRDGPSQSSARRSARPALWAFSRRAAPRGGEPLSRVAQWIACDVLEQGLRDHRTIVDPPRQQRARHSVAGRSWTRLLRRRWADCPCHRRKASVSCSVSLCTRCRSDDQMAGSMPDAVGSCSAGDVTVRIITRSGVTSTRLTILVDARGERAPAGRGGRPRVPLARPARRRERPGAGPRAPEGAVGVRGDSQPAGAWPGEIGGRVGGEPGDEACGPANPARRRVNHDHGVISLPGETAPPVPDGPEPHGGDMRILHNVFLWIRSGAWTCAAPPATWRAASSSASGSPISTRRCTRITRAKTRFCGQARAARSRLRAPREPDARAPRAGRGAARGGGPSSHDGARRPAGTRRAAGRCLRSGCSVC